MNNIIIKSKKTKTLNVHRYLEVESKFDPYYANVYCIMASKRTSHLSKNELKYVTTTFLNEVNKLNS